jgi:hypothetical protein
MVILNVCSDSTRPPGGSIVNGANSVVDPANAAAAKNADDNTVQIFFIPVVVVG